MEHLGELNTSVEKHTYIDITTQLAHSMTEIEINRVDPESYSTQFLLLLSQIVHEAAIPKLMISNAKPILNALKSHELVQDAPKGFLNEHQLVELFHALLNQCEITPNLEEEKANQKSKHAPDYITKLCEVLYERRIEEIESELSEDKNTFANGYRLITS